MNVTDADNETDISPEEFEATGALAVPPLFVPELTHTQSSTSRSLSVKPYYQRENSERNEKISTDTHTRISSRRSTVRAHAPLHPFCRAHVGLLVLDVVVCAIVHLFLDGPPLYRFLGADGSCFAWLRQDQFQWRHVVQVALRSAGASTKVRVSECSFG